MQILRPSFDSDRFFARVTSADTRVLMLDYDGTLAPFHDRPADAVPYPGVVAAIDAIMDAGHTRVVVVTGRWTRDLLPLLRLKRQPEVWGSYGWERVGAGARYDALRVDPEAENVLASVEGWADEIVALGGRLERKPAGIAFHWRGLPEPEAAAVRDAVATRWAPTATSDHVEWHDFDGGIELRAAGRGKGDVVRGLCEEAGGRAAVAYLGDDFADEDAFAEIPEHGAAVLVRADLRPTAASVWIRPPHELIEFLGRWRDAAGAR